MRERVFPLSVSRWSRGVLICIFCMTFGACAAGKSVQPPSAKPPEAVSAQPAETAPVVYYAGMDQLTVYSEPRSSSSPVTQLPLHQKVYRYKMEKGYAYIKVEGSGVTGWVDNARLIWRLPSQQQKAPTPTAAEAAAPEPPPTATETPTEQKPTSPAPSAPAAPSTPRPIGPSIFNPY